jgi:hypothetical protein
MQCNFKGIAPFEVTTEIALAIEMDEQPAVQFFRDEDGVPWALRSHVEYFVTDEAATHTSLNSPLEPL